MANLFSGWDNASAVRLTAYERILISVIALDFSERGGGPAIAQHLQSISLEMREAMMERAAKVLDEHEQANAQALSSQKQDDLWLDAVKHGVQAQMDDFSRRQMEAMNALRYYVQEKTSWASQLILGMVVAFFVAVLVGLGKIAVTIFD